MKGKNILLESEYNYLFEKKNISQKKLKHTLLANSGLNGNKDDGIAKSSVETVISTQNTFINQINEILFDSVVIPDIAIKNNTEGICKIGKTVELDCDNGEKKTINICGKKPLESKDGILNVSYDSPIGRSIIGKEVGDSFYYEVNGIEFTGEILSIKNMFN